MRANVRKPYLSNETQGVLKVFAGGCLWGFSGACGQFLFQNKGMVSSWLVPVRLLRRQFSMSIKGSRP